MEWLNLRTNFLHAEVYIRSNPTKRATWLNLSLWCASQENGGRIEGARAWKDREWQQVCGVTLREVNASAPLVTWEGDALLIWNYPHDREQEVRVKREAGKVHAAKRWGKPSGSEDGSPISSPIGSPMPELHAEGNRNRNRNRNNDLHTVASRPRNVLFDALCVACGEGDPTKLTRPTGATIGTALSHIKRATADVTPEEINRRAANYRTHFPDTILTASALSKHWARCADAALNLRTPNIGRKAGFA